MSVALRRAAPSDFPEVRRITRDAYLRAGHFAADHPYMTVLEGVEHRAEHAQVWVAETAGKVDRGCSIFWPVLGPLPRSRPSAPAE